MDNNDVSFQDRVWGWVCECFGAPVAYNVREREHRFIEEAIELVQASGCSKEDVLMLVDHVYGRPAGDVAQEVGGVMITLNALCTRRGVDVKKAAMAEYERINRPDTLEKIRLKQATKPKDSPLPEGTGAKETNEQGWAFVFYRRDDGTVVALSTDVNEALTTLYDQYGEGNVAGVVASNDPRISRLVVRSGGHWHFFAEKVREMYRIGASLGALPHAEGNRRGY